MRLQKVLRRLQVCRHLQPALVQVVLPECVQAAEALGHVHSSMAASHVHVQQAVDGLTLRRLLLLLLPLRAGAACRGKNDWPGGGGRAGSMQVV